MTEMTGFKGFDRFDKWVLMTVIGFMSITIWIGTHAPSYMNGGTCLLAGLVSGMSALGWQLWRALPKPAGYQGLWKALKPKQRIMSWFPPPEPLRVLDSMSTMSRYQLDRIREANPTKEQALECFRNMYTFSGRTITHFTVDYRDRAYDPIGAYRVVDGIAPAMEAPNRQEGMVNIFWYTDYMPPAPPPPPEPEPLVGEYCCHDTDCQYEKCCPWQCPGRDVKKPTVEQATSYIVQRDAVDEFFATVASLRGGREPGDYVPFWEEPGFFDRNRK